MSIKPPPFPLEVVHAWVDDRLDEARRAEVEAWLAANPEHARELRDWRQLDVQLRAAYAPILQEALPVRLQTAAQRRRTTWRMAAAIGWLALGGLIGAAGGYRYATHDETSHAPIQATTDFPRRAAIAHAVFTPEQRHPVEVGADQEAHLVAWLSKRLGTALRVPDLQARGYHLVGGRLLAADAGPGAQFMYQSESGERLTLYVTSGQGEDTGTAFRYAEERDIAVFYWVDEGFAYALAGKAARDALLPVADAVYRQLVR
ncbi:MAG: anti-sigma factor [Thauera sp.]|nr:anti-sigma factor [Thauera sp.]